MANKKYMKFIKSNPHPTGKKIGDCVVRALAIADAKKWNDVYQELCAIGFELKNMPNSKQVYEEYLIRNGWKKQKMPKHSTGKRMKLEEFANQNPKLTFVANVVKHLTIVETATLLDTWNCSRKCIGNYFIK